ncbi:AraC-like DNA-binding protein [Actinoplanes lutulentus]|uniref:AraC-like DNA-binding protein n=1 Tax=Actinoplanes lutulentus TaxID=1287878 RepID=A0A327YWR9_9ACTN|nr:AraC family transcriptional regulator [Actinoplanes lutulentus]MBB2943496.1 AraC-like DNA-binding protein [Actinoplanes lutulentus]RAK25985.1 AraC-like DNA-binding protein [Actinoplanes lutulentus]
MSPKAYSFVRTFPREPPRDLRVDQHYLLCASDGALRLEADGQAWLLPPARAALIEAGRAIRVSIPQPVTTASVLFDPAFVPAPPSALTVFDLSPLARALLHECGSHGTTEEPYAETLFGALAAVTWRLAESPSPVVVPAGRSPELRDAITLTEQRLGEHISFEQIAYAVGLAPRSLARRFEDETGMTWRAVLRRMRVLRAIEELAAGDTPITTVAFGVGYTSLSAFNAAFRQLTGRTPTDYRASFTNG